jgi:hypothetical protein
MRKLIFILPAVLIFIYSANAQSEQQNAVLMKMQSLKNALLSKDSVTLSSLLADDVTYAHSTGKIQTKAQLISDVMHGVQDYKSLEPSDMNVRVYDNASVVTLKLKVNVVAGGNDLTMNLFTTLTWIKINGDWKLVAREAVKLPD